MQALSTAVPNTAPQATQVQVANQATQQPGNVAAMAAAPAPSTALSASVPTGASVPTAANPLLQVSGSPAGTNLAVGGGSLLMRAALLAQGKAVPKNEVAWSPGRTADIQIIKNVAENPNYPDHYINWVARMHTTEQFDQQYLKTLKATVNGEHSTQTMNALITYNKAIFFWRYEEVPKHSHAVALLTPLGAILLPPSSVERRPVPSS